MHGVHKGLRRQGGWLALEALLALTMVMIALPVVQNYYASYQLENTSMAAAKHLQRIEQAVEGYVKANWAVVEAGATDTTPLEITQANLEAEGFLPTGFNMTNPFGQEYKAYVINPNADSLVSMVIGEGGRPGAGALEGSDLTLATEVIPGAAEKVGLTGGVVPYTQMPGTTAGVIEGTNGSWTFDVSTFAGGGFTQPTQGALASVNFFVSGAVNNDYLYRNDIGIPELNRMRTNLDMGGNSIEDVDNITASGRIRLEGAGNAGTDVIYAESGDVRLNDGKIYLDASGNTDQDVITVESGDIKLNDGEVYTGDVVFDDAQVWGTSNYVPTSASRGVYDMRLARPRDTIHKPQCPSGSVPRVFLSVDAAPTGQNMSVTTTSGLVTGDITSYRTSADNVPGNEWRVNLEVYMNDANRPDGWYTLNAGSGGNWSGSLVVAAKCT